MCLPCERCARLLELFSCTCKCDSKGPRVLECLVRNGPRVLGCLLHNGQRALECLAKAFYSSRPGSAWDFTHVRLIFMNDSFIKCVSSILKY